MITKQEALQMQIKIDNKKNEMATKKGQLDYLLEQIKTDFGVGSIDELQSFIDLKDSENVEIQDQINKLSLEIEKELAYNEF
jgi:hypothetical protein